MRILAYQGISATSRIVRWQTRSEYSHVAFLLGTNFRSRVIEAWIDGGVAVHESFRTVHTPNTKVDVYEFPECDHTELTAYLLKQVGMPYDWVSVARFVTHRPASENGAWFCSELVISACRHVGVNLLRIPAHHASPRDVAMSPLLTHAGTWVS